MGVTIEWTNKASVLAAVNKWPGIFEDEFKTLLTAAAALMAGRAQELAPSGAGTGAWGHLGNSITWGDPFPTNAGWRIVWGTEAEYAEPIEYGRAPGSRMPPKVAIAKWLWEERHKLSFPIETEKDAMRFAYVVARAIAKKGFVSAPDGSGKGWGMFEKAVKASAGDVAAILVAARARIEARCNAT